MEIESLIFTFLVSYSVLMKRWIVWWTECTTFKETVHICKDHNHNHEFVCLHGNHYEQQRSRNKVGSELPSLICIRDYEQFSLKKSVFARVFPRVILTWKPAYKGREKASRLKELISTSTWVARYPLAYKVALGRRQSIVIYRWNKLIETSLFSTRKGVASD